MKKIIALFIILLIISSTTCVENQKECISYNRVSNKYRLGFSSGPCNPVIFIPGLFGSTLYLNINNCSGFLASKEHSRDFRYHCINSNICKDSKSNEFNQKNWPSLTGEFGFIQSEKNYSNICYSYFMQFTNEKKDCNDGAICRYSEYVRITPFPKPQKANEYVNPMDSITNLLGLMETQSTKGFLSMYNKLIGMGYENNFSLAALPYDFRESVCENTQFKQTLTELLKLLINNTKKNVVIIAHSYGNLNILYQIANDAFIKDSIKHIISIGPPFLGSVSGTEYLFSGNKEQFSFHESILFKADISLTSQYMLFSNIPVTYQLLPVSPSKLLEDDYYSSLREALKGTINKELFTFEYDSFLGFDKSPNENDSIHKDYTLYNVFPKTFHSFHSLTLIDQINYLNISCLEEPENKHLVCSHYSHLNMYNDFELPQVTLFSRKLPNNKINLTATQKQLNYLMSFKSIPNQFNNKIRNYCNIEHNASPTAQKSCEKYFDDTYSINNFHKSYQYYNDKCRDFRESLPNPEIDITIIFNKTFQTKVSLIYNNETQKTKYKYFGGDGTVPSASSLIPAFKWIFENKMDKKNGKNRKYNKIKLVDFCSIIYGNPLDTSVDPELNYINCMANQNIDHDVIRSNHANMISDEYLIEYIASQLLIIDLDNEKTFIKKRNTDNEFYLPKVSTIFMNTYFSHNISKPTNKEQNQSPYKIKLQDQLQNQQHEIILQEQQPPQQRGRKISLRKNPITKKKFRISNKSKILI